MLFSLEAINAGHGDALLLHYGDPNDPSLLMIDGGVHDIWDDWIKPRFEEILALRGVNPPLDIRVAMVSHIDNDHVTGVLDMFTEFDGLPLNERIARVGTLWHNTFDDIIGNGETATIAGLSSWIGDAGAASIARLGVDLHSLAVVADVESGRDLRLVADRLPVAVNAGFDDERVAAPETINLGAGTRLHVIGPSTAQLTDLEAKWDEKLQEILDDDDATARAKIAAFLDRSVANLASIVVLVEQDDLSMLLTGDARGDFILQGLRDGGFMDANDRINVDLLKVPHHGSDRNVAPVFFEKVRARHYVFSGDGTVGSNPDISTLEMLTEARGSARYTMHFTNHLTKIDTFITEDHNDNTRNYDAWVRDEDYFSVWVDLADELVF